MFGRENPRIPPHFSVRSAPPPAGVVFNWPQLTPPTWALSLDGSLVSRQAYNTLLDILNPRRQGTFTNGAATITGMTSTVDMFVGMPVEGPGIPAATTIISIQSISAATMSANFTGVTGGQGFRGFHYGAGDGLTTWGLPDDRGQFWRPHDPTGLFDQSNFTGTVTTGLATVTGLSSTLGMYVGQPIVNGNFAGGTTVASITSSTAITVSNNSSGTGPTAIQFNGRALGATQSDDIRSHTHQGGTQVNVSPSAATLVQNINGGGNAESATGNLETRPRNKTYLPCIVY